MAESEKPKTKLELTIENAVLRCADKFREKVEQTVEKQQEKTEKLVTKLSDDYAEKADAALAMATAAKETADKAHARITKLQVSFGTVAASCSVLGGFAGFLISQLIK